MTPRTWAMASVLASIILASLWIALWIGATRRARG